MIVKKDIGQDNFWRQIEELEMDIQEWIQLLESLDKEKTIKKGETIFGELTLEQIIGLVRELVLGLNKYLNLINIDGKERREKEKLLEKTEEVIEIWKRKITESSF